MSPHQRLQQQMQQNNAANAGHNAGNQLGGLTGAQEKEDFVDKFNNNEVRIFHPKISCQQALKDDILVNTDVHAPAIKLMSKKKKVAKSDSPICSEAVSAKKEISFDKKISPWIFIVPTNHNKSKKLTRYVHKLDNFPNEVSHRSGHATKRDKPTKT
jgi:hypothetical protein